jgi:hypothetical protein
MIKKLDYDVERFVDDNYLESSDSRASTIMVNQENFIKVIRKLNEVIEKLNELNDK